MIKHRTPNLNLGLKASRELQNNYNFKSLAYFFFFSKLLWPAKNWCMLSLAGKLENFLLHWLALSSFCYFQLCWLVDRHHTKSWLGFSFLKRLARW